MEKDQLLLVAADQLEELGEKNLANTLRNLTRTYVNSYRPLRVLELQSAFCDNIKVVVNDKPSKAGMSLFYTGTVKELYLLDTGDIEVVFDNKMSALYKNPSRMYFPTPEADKKES